jgi:DNA topoisomerase IB
MAPLRYVTDEHTGIRRRRAGAEFVHQNAEARRIRDAATLDREEFTAKDFRTWAGTVLAACPLGATAQHAPQARSKTARNRHIVAAIDQVSMALGNTRSVCRKCYVHPAILNSYLDGRTLALVPRVDEDAAFKRVLGSRSVERAVLALLREASKSTARVGSSYSTSGPMLANGKPRPGNSLATDGRGAGTWRQQLIDSRNRRSRNSTSGDLVSKPRSRRRRRSPKKLLLPAM